MSKLCPVCQQEVDDNLEVCSACGFRLQGSTEKFEPIEVSRDQAAAQPSQAEGASLRIIRGPHTGATYQLDPELTTIGRSPDCTLFLNDMTVSRLHATIRPLEGALIIQDENSFNGVWINNKNVETKALEAGDILQIGTFCLIFEQDN